MRKPRLYLLYLAAGSGLLLGQSYQGNLDSANCGSITGYAWNGTTTPINVDFYDGATYVTSVLANQDTGTDSYLEGDYHGFSLPTPLTLKDNQIHSIYVRYGGTTINLAATRAPSNAIRRPRATSIISQTPCRASTRQIGPRTEH